MKPQFLAIAAIIIGINNAKLYLKTKTAEDCQKLCSLAQRCKRFDYTQNKNCWLMNDDCKLTHSPGKSHGQRTGAIMSNIACGMETKNGVSLAHLNPYWSAKDFSKCNVKAKNAEDCQTICNLTSDCGRFSYSNSYRTCYLKKWFGVTVQYDTKYQSGAKSSWIHPNMLLVNGDFDCSS